MRFFGHMKLLYALALLLFSVPTLSKAESRIYMVGKIKILATTHTQVVLFYDQGISSMPDCQREIQRGNHGQWRYYHHKFSNPHGYQQRIDYYCVQSDVIADPWYDRARFDFIYKVDIRDTRMRISKQNSYSDCLSSVRREVTDETNRFFCAKLSQAIDM